MPGIRDHALPQLLALVPVLLLLGAAAPRAPTAAAAAVTPPPLLVVGSLNADTTILLDRLPARGECLQSIRPVPSMAVGGKGANQAVAAARLRAPGAPPPRFACRFGDDGPGKWMESELRREGLDLSLAAAAPGVPSGSGIVWLDAGGAATSVVLGGANTEGWGGAAALAAAAAAAVRGAGALLLQREVPEAVNAAFASAAAAAGVPVLLDAGGVDAPAGRELLAGADYFAPNELELQRLTGLPTASLAQAHAAARSLVDAGARRVLVTLGERGALLIDASRGAGEEPEETRQPPLPVPGGAVVDATAAGDAFRAAFAVALAQEGRTPREALRFAAAAGALAVARAGAMPSLPTRAEVEALLAAHPASEDGDSNSSSSGGGGGGDDSSEAQGAAGASARGTEVARPPRARGAAAGGGTCPGAPGAGGGTCPGGGAPPGASAERCPLRFASRLNSMRARRELVEGSPGDAARDDVIGWIARQGRVRGLGAVYFNHPQHTEGRTPQQLLAALASAGLAAAGVALRFPEAFRAGAFTNPDADARAAALALAADGCRWARELGADEVVVWSAFDGYDYHLQADYGAAWSRAVEGLRALADACPGVEVALEWKPTDPASRFSFVPSTGAALLLARQVNRTNFGLTLDTGHMLMAGENSAQSVALAAAEGRLFGVHLNDGHSRVGAEDGLVFGSVHSSAALELVYWLRRVGFDGTVYFDTFPSNEDPVREAELNVRRFKALWARAAALDAAGAADHLARHDALGAMEVADAAEAAAAGAGAGAGGEGCGCGCGGGGAGEEV
ncbi:ribokinase xylose isomerase [Raphidocelis subcapitata]|uniref:Ribokinase n=1 Tax=Raphidocelis subcapitata TaxID=307507 RepID=A0A2V0NJT6_9CHLO|nr:ribokinase xylose isomerase [Raphidocelis subcapitata]|eukprot:GBF87518.1 ribokinase xylose isomerase [Raphidocelis subcapitata]